MPCSHGLHIPTTDSLLASHRSSTGVVFHGVYPTHHDRYTVPFDRGRLFRIPFAQTSLIHDRLQFRSTRPGYFSLILSNSTRIPKRSTNNNDRCPAHSIDRGDLYRTCTPNVIHYDRRTSILSPFLLQSRMTRPTGASPSATPPTVPYLQCVPRHVIHHGHRTFHSMNLSIQNTRISNRPTEAASTATSPTDHCILCMPRHQPIQPARPVLSTATCIAFPSLFQSHQHNTHPAHIFRVPAAILSTSFRLPSPGHLHTCVDHGAQPRSLLTTTIVPRAGATALSRAHNLLRNRGRRELISLYQSDC